MKKISIFIISLLFFGVVKILSVEAADSPDFITDCPGQPVVNIVHTVTNDVDSRASIVNGVWAKTDYIRRLRVWRAYPSIDIFCAKAEYKGIFTTYLGESPQGTDVNIAAGIDGTFQGGYRTTYFIGALNQTPDLPRTGNLGNMDYQCQSTDPGDHSSCNNYWRWQDTYFNSIRPLNPVNGELDWFGWRYDTDLNGVWIHRCAGRGNICPGNKGDITDD